MMSGQIYVLRCVFTFPYEVRSRFSFTSSLSTTCRDQAEGHLQFNLFWCHSLAFHCAFLEWSESKILLFVLASDVRITNFVHRTRCALWFRLISFIASEQSLLTPIWTWSWATYITFIMSCLQFRLHTKKRFCKRGERMLNQTFQRILYDGWKSSVQNPFESFDLSEIVA